MYAYVFDSFLQERKYQHDISQIETRLVALGVQGRSEKMTILKNIQEAARQAIKRGTTTIVVVGNDQTIAKVLPQLIGQPVTLGLIPLGRHQTIAHVLGIPEGLVACDVLSRRVVQRLDLGKANDVYFLHSLTAPATVSVDFGKYRVTSLDPGGSLTISNFPFIYGHGHPDDGQLELIVAPGHDRRGWGRRRDSAASVFPMAKAILTSAPGSADLLLDGQITIRTPAKVEVVPRRLEVIVGKNRGF